MSPKMTNIEIDVNEVTLQFDETIPMRKTEAPRIIMEQFSPMSETKLTRVDKFSNGKGSVYTIS